MTRSSSQQPARERRRNRDTLLCVALTAVALLFGSADVRAQDPAQDAPPAPALVADPSRETPLVLSIEVEGEKRYTEEQLRGALGQRAGAALDPRGIEQGLDTLWKAFHVRASVSLREEPDGVRLLLAVVEMPVDLEPRFAGNADIDEETLRRWAEIGEKSELYLYQAARVRERLLEGYRREGYYFAEVQEILRGAEPVADGAEAPLPDVIFEIREGPKVRVKDVVLRGNESMPDTGTLFWKDGISALAQRELAGPRLFNWLGDEFVAEILDADLVAMREVYRDRGWLDAVVEVERLEFSDDRSRVTIHVRVDEGLPYRVSKLTIRAVAPDETGRDWEPAELLFSEAELLDLLELAPGKRYERSTQRKDEIALRQHYGKRGYLSHPSLRGLDPFEFLDPDLRFDLDAHEVEVTYRISQGRKRFLREVLFEGGEYTRDRVLRREVRALPGEIADLEEINRSLRRLSETSYFSDDFLPLDHQEPTYRFLPVEGDPSLVDLEYRIQEGRVVNFQIQGGVDSNSGLFGRISLSMRNFDIADAPESLWSVFGDVYDKEAFHGAGQRLDLELSPGTEINYYRVRFVEPDLFRTHFERYSLDAELKSQVQSFRAYDEERISRTVRIGREFGTKVFAKVGYTNQDLFIDDIDAPLAGINDPTGFPLPEGLFEQEGSSDLNGGLFDLSYRDVDTTINTREGFLAVMRNGLYGGAFGGDYQYVRSQLDLDWYWQLGPEEEDVRPGIHLGLGMGIGDGFGDSDEVPYTERFFLGGSKTLRGFDFRGVGPSVGGEPIGGETMLSGTLEYRRPLYSTVQPGTYRRQEIFRLVLFADAGILDPDPWSVDLDEVRASLGFGIGMAYPIPIAINFGFPIASKDGDREEVFSFTIFSLWF